VLKQASVSDIKAGRLSRDDGHIAITMRFYPRFLRKELRDEFIAEMAPDKELLHDFNAAQKKLGEHNGAFAESDYQNRFQISDKGLAHLERLSEMSKHKDVYLLCVCKVGEMCHREILMLLAQKLFHCKIGEVYHDYPVVMSRIKEFQRQ
jgi:uncharacterized protein YeaO (DUF488 family)